MVANDTHVPLSPRAGELRARELLVEQEATPECRDEAWDQCFESIAVFDQCAA